MKRIRLTALCTAAALLAVCTGCRNSSPEPDSAADSTAPESTTTAEETAAPVTTAAQPEFQFGEAAAAGRGDAILSVTDSSWFCQYWGAAEDILAYDAGIVHIDGDGDYTVSVTADTAGAQYAMTSGKGPFTGNKCKGLAYAAVRVIGGAELCPDMNIEITEIRVDGKPIELQARNYTAGANSTDLCANIFNSWIDHLPDDAHSSAGSVAGDIGEYAPRIVSQEDFAEWSSFAVDFTVSGMEGSTEPAGE